MSTQFKTQSVQPPSPQEIADGYRALGNLIGRPPLSHVTREMGRLIDAHFFGSSVEQNLIAGLIQLAQEPDRFPWQPPAVPTTTTTFEVVEVRTVPAMKRLGSGK